MKNCRLVSLASEKELGLVRTDRVRLCHYAKYPGDCSRASTASFLVGRRKGTSTMYDTNSGNNKH